VLKGASGAGCSCIPVMAVVPLSRINRTWPGSAAGYKSSHQPSNAAMNKRALSPSTADDAPGLFWRQHMTHAATNSNGCSMQTSESMASNGGRNAQ